jgi:PKD repeat protein
MAGDAFDSGSQCSPTVRIAAGPYTLEVGDPAGMTLVATSSRSASCALRRATARDGKRERRRPPEAIEADVDDASDVTSKLERAVSLWTETASGRLDIKSVSDEVDALIDLLARLDRAERWPEALRAARCLSMLLALIGRWIELLRSLRIALHAAEELGDQLGQAWASHELGTLHLAAGRHAKADRLLGRARELRERCGDRDGLDGLAVTDRNLQVLCRTLRQQLHPQALKWIPEPFRRSPVLAALVAATLVVLGGAAGAVIGRSGRQASLAFHRARVTFSFTPSSPHVGQRVVFTATASDPRDPVVSYTWRWGDGDPAAHRVESHVYLESRTYKATLIVRDALGRVTGKTFRLVVVQRPPFPGPNAAFSFHPRSPTVDEPVAFDASSSFDPSARIVDYSWEFGDGKTGHGAVVTHAYGEARAYRVSLKVTDAHGDSNTLTETIAVGLAGGRRQTQMGLICPPSSVTLEEAVPVSGSITPPRPGAPLTVTYTGPSGQKLTATPTSDGKGSYEASETPNAAGRWSVQTSWLGDAEYLPSASEACTFFVEEPTKVGLHTAKEKGREEQEREKVEREESERAERERSESSGAGAPGEGIPPATG